MSVMAFGFLVCEMSDSTRYRRIELGEDVY